MISRTAARERATQKPCPTVYIVTGFARCLPDKEVYLGDMVGFVRRGSPASTVAAHEAALRRFFARRVSAVDVDDLVQETLARIEGVSASTQVIDTERYLFRTARNVLIDRHRVDRSEQVAYEQILALSHRDVDEVTPERAAIAREEFARMRQIVLTMPERTRTAFLLRRFENLRYQEIARLMGISTNSVKSLLHRAIVIVAAEQTRMDRKDA